MSYRIKDLPESSRPREKLWERGEGALSDAELLAIILGSGSRGKSALDLAHELLKEGGGLKELASWSLDKLSSFAGMGRAKAAQVKAALSLAGRLSSGSLKGKRIKSPLDAVEFLKAMFSFRKREFFGAIYLNQSNLVLKAEVLHSGGRKNSMVDVGLLMKRALEIGATRLIIFHNHPSGNPEPSAQDRALTERIRKAASLLDIDLLDHIIIGGDKFFSFEEGG